MTASDILYHEIVKFKEKTGDKVVAMMMNVAASGGYYIALPSDYIMAHPTTVTGSVGVIFLRPKIYDLMDKIGVSVEADTSGANKDMGSPFRKATEEEDKIFQGLTDQLGQRFISLVVKHRNVDPVSVADISSARIYLAQEALKQGLVDEIGYLSNALDKAKELAGLDRDCKVVVYRREKYPDDNIYNNTQTRFGGGSVSLVDLGLIRSALNYPTGFYYLWPAGIDGQR